MHNEIISKTNEITLHTLIFRTGKITDKLKEMAEYMHMHGDFTELQLEDLLRLAHTQCDLTQVFYDRNQVQGWEHKQ